MAYGKGRSRLIAEIGKEQAFEARRYSEELEEAEKAAREESQGKTLWQTVGSVAGALAGAATMDPRNIYKGYLAGGEVGKWGYNWLGSDYDPEDYALSTDMGRFNVTQDIDIKDVNRRFQEAHESQFWQDIAGTGKTIGTFAYLGSDLGKLFQPTGSKMIGELYQDIPLRA
jgi:phage tail tape-measure protein